MFVAERFGTLGGQAKGGVSFQLFSYLTTDDSKDDILVDGYFDDTRQTLRVNDVIQVLDKTEEEVKQYFIRISLKPLEGGVKSEEIMGDSPIAEVPTPVAETPTGVIDGANTEFTLSETPSGTAGVLVLLDGIMQYNGVDYSVTGDTITFTTAPATGSSIFSYYNITSADGTLGDKEARINLNLAYNIAKESAYKEFTFASGKLTGIDIWETSSKTTKLFTKTLSFTGDVLNTVTTVDELNSKTLTKTFTYNGSDIDTISEVIT